MVSWVRVVQLHVERAESFTQLNVGNLSRSAVLSKAQDLEVLSLSEYLATGASEA